MTMGVAGESRKNVLGGGNRALRDAVIGARPALRYAQLRHSRRSKLLTVWAAKWRMSQCYNLNSCEIVTTVDHATSWRGTDSWAKSDDDFVYIYSALAPSSRP
jgi:hypothetical protein